MICFKEECGTITINGQFSCSVDVFKVLEPTYQPLPEGYTQRLYFPGKSHTLISDKGYQPVLLDSTWIDGDRYISRIEDFILLKNYILRDEIETNDLILSEINKRLPYDEKRKAEYPSIELLVIALWNHIVEKKSKEVSGILDLQKKRTQIKTKYPKE
jgi:hypothetical protein